MLSTSNNLSKRWKTVLFAIVSLNTKNLIKFMRMIKMKAKTWMIKRMNKASNKKNERI
jgi:hypothetical protein